MGRPSSIAKILQAAAAYRLQYLCNVVAPYAKGWTSRQYYCTVYSLGTRAVFIKILGKIKGVDNASKIEGGKNKDFLRPISRFNGTRYRHSYNRRRMRSIDVPFSMTFNDPSHIFRVTYIRSTLLFLLLTRAMLLTVQDRHIFRTTSKNLHTTRRCNFVWPWTTLIDLQNF